MKFTADNGGGAGVRLEAEEGADQLELTQDEIHLLRQVGKGPQIISGNRSRDGLKRLVDFGWITERALNVSVTEYAITEAGRAILSTQISDETIPVEDLNASNDE